MWNWRFLDYLRSSSKYFFLENILQKCVFDRSKLIEYGFEHLTHFSKKWAPLCNMVNFAVEISNYRAVALGKDINLDKKNQVVIFLCMYLQILPLVLNRFKKNWNSYRYFKTSQFNFILGVNLLFSLKETEHIVIDFSMTRIWWL